MGVIPAIVLLAIMGVDWLAQYTKLKESNNIRRLITGIAGGVGLTYVYYMLIKLVIEFIRIMI